MSQGSKIQPYTYSLKSVAFSDTANDDTICDDVMFFYVTPPDNSISIENLNTRIVLEFVSGVSSGNRVIEQIGIADTLDHDLSAVTRLRSLTVNWTADANRVIDKSIDLTALLKNDDVTYRELPGIDASGCTYVFIKLPDALDEQTDLGKVKLWKADALFTTTGIL